MKTMNLAISPIATVAVLAVAAANVVGGIAPGKNRRADVRQHLDWDIGKYGSQALRPMTLNMLPNLSWPPCEHIQIFTKTFRLQHAFFQTISFFPEEYIC